MISNTVESFMTKNIVTLPPTASIREAVKHMAEKSISCVVIVDSENKPSGIVTERDIVKKVSYKNVDPDNTLISSIMTSPVVSIPKDTNVLEAMMTMQKNKFRRVIVTDAAGVLIGLVTQTDLFKAVVTMGT